MTSDAASPPTQPPPLPPGAAWATGDADGIRASGTPDGGTPAPAAAGLGGALALWPVLGTLVEEGALRLHTPLDAYGLPGRATAHQLLTSGRGPAGPAGGPPGSGPDHVPDRDGTLTRLAEEVTGTPLAELAATRVWQPLGMAGTTHGPEPRTTVEDAAAFLRHLLAPGQGPLTAAWIADSLRIRTGELFPARGLMWRPVPGSHPRQDLWVHHAVLGPSALWVSPRHGRWGVLLAPPTAPSALRDHVRDLVPA
ncbi:hypothetical protein [Streptomyces sp. NPDC089799]|uniref:hypothetical protein n=1 Tax=Streptomyces sp. NPDC089799 TaxID=3155066 RepID=UPI003418E5D4